MATYSSNTTIKSNGNPIAAVIAGVGATVQYVVPTGSFLEFYIHEGNQPVKFLYAGTATVYFTPTSGATTYINSPVRAPEGTIITFTNGAIATFTWRCSAQLFTNTP